MGRVAIPSSSGHWFLQDHEPGAPPPVGGGRNPFFIRSLVPSPRGQEKQPSPKRRNPFFIRSLVPSLDGVRIIYSDAPESQSLLHQVIGSFDAIGAVSDNPQCESQSLLHQVIGSFMTRSMSGVVIYDQRSQSLLHQVIGSFYPSPTGTTGPPRESQSLLHQVIGSFLERGLRVWPHTRRVAIPSSSGHWFLRHIWTFLSGGDSSRRNPFFIRSLVPSVVARRDRGIPSHRVAIPSSSGHWFLLSASRASSPGRRVAIPSSSGHWFLRTRNGIRSGLIWKSQSLLHQVIGSFSPSVGRIHSSPTVAIPSSSGHWFLRANIGLSADKSVVAIPSSSGHWFLPSLEAAFFVMARRVAIPSSSGHWFLPQGRSVNGNYHRPSQSLLHQVIGSFGRQMVELCPHGSVAIPSSSGHWFLRSAAPSSAGMDSVAIPSSSGHWFLPILPGQLTGNDWACRNPFFIRSLVPSVLGGGYIYALLHVAIPSSSGHWFLQRLTFWQ